MDQIAGVTSAEFGPADDGNLENAIAFSSDAPKGIVAFTFELETPASQLINARVKVLSGAAAGCAFYISGARGDAVTAFWFAPLLQGVAAGDDVEIDNDDYLAFAALHRHLQDFAYPETRHIGDAATQRGAPRVTFSTHVPPPTGKFKGKVILLQHLHDVACPPNVARAFVKDVRSHLGDAIDSAFRLWYIDNALHLPPVTKEGGARFIQYCYGHAVRDAIAWVERGIAPPKSTSHGFDDANGLVLPPSADERGGVQPVLQVSAQNAAVTYAKVGEEVSLSGEAQAPPNAGWIVKTEWDPTGFGDWPICKRYASSDDVAASARHDTSHRYTEPGVYFPSFRATSNRNASGSSLYDVTNVARARVVVRP